VGHVAGTPPTVPVHADRGERIVVHESGWPEQVRVVLRQVVQLICVPIAHIAIRIEADGPDILEVELRTSCISLVRGGPDAGVVSRERGGHCGPVAERAIAESGSMVAVFDRPGVPLATASGPRELSRLDAHVHVANDLAAAWISGVEEVYGDDGARRFAGR